jgi:hypothetical protein
LNTGRLFAFRDATDAKIALADFPHIMKRHCFLFLIGSYSKIASPIGVKLRVTIDIAAHLIRTNLHTSTTAYTDIPINENNTIFISVTGAGWTPSYAKGMFAVHATFR